MFFLAWPTRTGIIFFTPEMFSRDFGMKVELPLFGSTNKRTAGGANEDRAGLRSFVWPPILTESPGYHRLTRKFFKIMKLGAGNLDFRIRWMAEVKTSAERCAFEMFLSMAQLVTGFPSLGRNLPKVARS